MVGAGKKEDVVGFGAGVDAGDGVGDADYDGFDDGGIELAGLDDAWDGGGLFDLHLGDEFDFDAVNGLLLGDCVGLVDDHYDGDGGVNAKGAESLQGEKGTNAVEFVAELYSIGVESYVETVFDSYAKGCSVVGRGIDELVNGTG